MPLFKRLAPPAARALLKNIKGVLPLLRRLAPPTARALLTWQEKLIQQWQRYVLSHWRELRRFQKLYVIAALCLVIHIPTAVALTLLALVVDFWPRFAKMWESLACKALVLVVYAATTNFALVSAASMVNDITGLDASYFPYAHYTAILLNLPSWIFGTSLTVLVLLQLLFPFFIITVLGLRLLGIRSTQLFKSIQYPVITMCLRFALSLLLVIKGIDLIGEDETDNIQIGANEETSDLSEQTKQHDDTSPWIRLDDELMLTDKSYNGIIRQVLAHFIFYFEANKQSRCQLEENLRSVELNEYQHVEISKDKNQPGGYQFSVRACKSPGLPNS